MGVLHGLAFLLCGVTGASPEPPRGADLVELVSLDPTVRLDIRYATPDNLARRAVYAQARAFLQRPVAEALLRVHRALKARGLGLLVFDGYRPWSVTKLFWDLSPPDQRAFVANPARGSNHNRGCAVDLSLFDLLSGQGVEMPSGYDEMSPRASPGYPGGTPDQRARRDLLRAAMEKEEFVVDRNEWWHFNHRDCRRYPILDVPFESLPPPPPR
ncbi:MAG TPA: M15 family metallopeptidase [Vicinamibacteria bacterium]|jgi:D-alanyl-D-alanine dipeptidase|nr:M15 family metallopeptidase [Vicinamibacteria bacterium]